VRVDEQLNQLKILAKKKAFHLFALLIVHWRNRVYCRAWASE